jgi:hypothetical protein
VHNADRRLPLPAGTTYRDLAKASPFLRHSRLRGAALQRWNKTGQPGKPGGKEVQSDGVLPLGSAFRGGSEVRSADAGPANPGAAPDPATRLGQGCGTAKQP